MKITKLLFAIVVVLFVVSSCKKSQDSLTDVIPSNASYVMYINGKSLKEKSNNYDLFQNVTVSRAINMVKAMLNKKEAIDMIDALTKDINSSGLNLTGDCYLFSDYSVFGLVLGVNDAEKFKNALINFSVEQEEALKAENGIYMLSLTPNHLIVWNKDKFLLTGLMNVYGNSEKNIDVKEYAKKQLLQDRKESIHSNQAFAEFMNAKKDISVFYAYSNIDFLDVMKNMSGMGFPEEIKNELNDLKGVSASMNMSFEKGEIKADNRTFYNTPETEKKYKEIMESITGELKGDQFKYIPENPIFAMSANIKGGGLYDYLNKLKIIPLMEKNIPDSIINLQSIFNNVEGDFTFALNDIATIKKSYTYGSETVEYDSQKPLFAVLVDVKNGADILNLIAAQTDDEFKKIDDNSYSFDMGDDAGTSYLGQKDNVLYFTNDDVVYKNLQGGDLKNNLMAAAKGNSAFMTGNIHKFRNIISTEVSEEVIRDILLEGINQTGNYSYALNKDMSGQGKWEFTDKNQNSFAVICQFVDQILAKVNDSMRF